MPAAAARLAVMVPVKFQQMFQRFGAWEAPRKLEHYHKWLKGAPAMSFRARRLLGSERPTPAQYFFGYAEADGSGQWWPCEINQVRGDTFLGQLVNTCAGAGCERAQLLASELVAMAEGRVDAKLVCRFSTVPTEHILLWEISMSLRSRPVVAVTMVQSARSAVLAAREPWTRSPTSPAWPAAGIVGRVGAAFASAAWWAPGVVGQRVPDVASSGDVGLLDADVPGFRLATLPSGVSLQADGELMASVPRSSAHVGVRNPPDFGARLAAAWSPAAGAALALGGAVGGGPPAPGGAAGAGHPSPAIRWHGSSDLLRIHPDDMPQLDNMYGVHVSRQASHETVEGQGASGFLPASALTTASVAAAAWPTAASRAAPLYDGGASQDTLLDAFYPRIRRAAELGVAVGPPLVSASQDAWDTADDYDILRTYDLAFSQSSALSRPRADAGAPQAQGEDLAV